MFKTLIAALFVVAMFSFVGVAQAQTFDSPAELAGFVWAGTQNASDGSRQGVGWISLNCANVGECGDGDYEVVVNTDFTVAGYGWIGGNSGLAYGYVRFGGVSGCPGGGDCQARVVEKTDDQFEFEGWARACAVYVSGCSGALKTSSQRGGWDGWISLSCENTGGCGTSNYSVKIAKEGNFSSNSYAWGSDVMGRLTFSLTTIDEPCTYERSCFDDFTGYQTRDIFCQLHDFQCASDSSCDAATNYCATTNTTITGSFSCESTLVRYNETTSCSWTIPAGANRCELRGSTIGSVTSPVDVISGLGGDTKSIVNNTRYKLFCFPTAGGAAIEVDSLDIRALPRVFET